MQINVKSDNKLCVVVMNRWYLPHQSIYLLLIVVLIHDVSIYFDVGYRVDGMPLEISLVHCWVHIQARGSKMIGARDVRYNALAALSLPRLSHPHVPIPEDIGGRPFWLQFAFVQFTTQHPKM